MHGRDLHEGGSLMTTRANIIQRVARELGGYTGIVQSGSATTAVLGGLIGTSGDNYLLKDAVLYFPGASVADQERVVTNWVDSTGTATFATRSDSNPANDEYVAFPKNTYNVTTVRNAIDDVMTKTRRTWRNEVILNPDQRSYPVREIDWLRSRKDIDAVHYRTAPNLIRNEDFSRWHGTDLEAWSAGTKTTNFAVGDYAMQLTYVDTTISSSQTIPFNYVRWMADQNGSKELAFGVLVETDNAQTRMSINDGVSTSYTNYSTDGLEWLTGTHTVSPLATQLVVTVQVEGAGTSTFARCIVQSGTPLNEMLQRGGSTSYIEQEVTENTRNVGGSPVIEIPYGKTGQLVVYSRRGYEVPDDDEEELDIPEQVLFHGTMYDLMSLHRRAEDRTRPDRVALLHGAAYQNLSSDLIDIPVGMPLSRSVVSGA